MFKILNRLPRWLRLTFVFPLFFLNGFLLVFLLDYLQPLVNFLITATILAFLLELLVQEIQKRGIRRGLAIAIVLLITLFIVITLGFVLIPLMVEQLSQLMEKAPQWVNDASQHLQTWAESPRIRNTLSNFDLSEVLNQGVQKLSTALESFGSQLLNVLLGAINSIFNALIIFILTIFLLIGGEKFWEGLFNWLPIPWNQRIPSYLQKTFKDYFFSRIILAGFSSVARLVIFVFLGVPFSLLFAFGIGIASLIPFVAGLIILVATILLSFNDPALGLKFFLSAIIIDQVTDNVIAPRIMGELIGLNPIWILISLFVGAKMGGILGLLLAVPLASVIKQIIDALRNPQESLEESPLLVESDGIETGAKG